jgi:tRNA dimethylallyltransferase
MPGAPKVLIALYGPTSSGKTKLSVELAERLGPDVVIISADSRQVYRYLDIGTSKTTPEEMHGIPHEMLDVTEPVRKLELEDYTRLAREHIAACFSAGKVPFVVGGTGVYVKALLEGWDVERSASARDSLRRDFPRGVTADAHAMLRRLDRQVAARVHPNNYEAIINALTTLMAPDTASPGDTSDVTPVVLGLQPNQRALDQRVADTYDRQVSRGLFGEIQDLNARYGLDAELRRRGPAARNQVLHTHGYREYFEVAAERGKPVERLTEHERAEVRTRVVAHIRGYTRRQQSFLRKLPSVHIVTSAKEAVSFLPRSVGLPR